MKTFQLGMTDDQREYLLGIQARSELSEEQSQTLIGPGPQNTDNPTHETSVEPKKPHKASFVGAPAIFELELACADLNRAFGGFGCYHVGSSLERADWRDVDVRFILEDEDFQALFPNAHLDSRWELDPRWLVLTSSISRWLSSRTGLPIDFQFQARTFANAHHQGARSALGLSGSFCDEQR